MASTAELSSFQYEAGGCTLEISGEVSSLARIAGKPVLKRLRFRLQLREGTNNLLDARGMRSHLVSLQRAVEVYLQQYLTATTPNNLSMPETTGVYIQPRGLTRHRLHLADWGIASVPAALDLNSRQFNNLVQVLDQMDAAMELLPRQLRSSHPSVIPWRWAGTAAAVLLAVGGFGLLWPWLNQSTVSEAPLDSRPSPEVTGTIPSPELEIAQEEPASEMSPPEPESSLDESSPVAVQPQQPVSVPTTPPEATSRAAPPTAAPAPASSPPSPPASAQDVEAQPEANVAPPTPAATSPPAPATLSEPEAAAMRRQAPAGTAEQDGDQPAAGEDVSAWVAALESALQERWRALEPVPQPLEYRLVLSEDGLPQRLELIEGGVDPAERSIADLELPPAPASLSATVKVTVYPDGAVRVNLGP